MSNYIYAYTHTGNAKKWKRPAGQKGEFWIKVGQTTKPGIGRVKAQVNTAFPGLNGVDILFHSEPAERPNGVQFSDHDVHKVLTGAGITQTGGEWFEASPDEVLGAVVSLQKKVPFNPERIQTFGPRPEQKRAVQQTAKHFRRHDGDEPSAPKYLWNAKMRFGKTFTTYQLAREMGWKKVLVLTYKPAVRSAWRDDLLGHVDFVDWRYIDRDTPSADADDIVDGVSPFVWFASFQDVTGRDPEGQPKPRNETLHIVEWDCIVIDEFHFGAATVAARELYDPQDRVATAFAKVVEKALDQGNDSEAELLDFDFGLTTKFHLHLSGTPFKAITNGEYAEDQVFNWTYIDEQREKRKAEQAGGVNHYAELPRMEMYTYAMGDAAGEWAEDGEFSGFDLNSYFKAKKVGEDYSFEKPDDVASFLDLIRGKKQVASGIIEGDKPPFPYEAAQFKEAVQHTVWYLPDVAACEAMADLLRADPFFSTYEVYVAAGTNAKIGAAALEPLQKAIKRSETNGKSGSIALSCGKLMTGVTVPQWSSIFMLRSLKAPESYFQAAFRVQSPWKEEGIIKKDTAYVFEFDPNRALSLVALYGTEIANNEGDRNTTQRDVLGELINFLPIFAIDGGQMERLDTDAILDWAHGGISANSLARKWRSVDLYNLNGVTMGRLLEDEDLLAELEQIEDFRNIREEAEKVVTASQNLGEVKRAGGSKAEQKKPKKELALQRKSIREKLKKVSAKVLIFMYVTDFREERLLHVIESLDTELFLRATGLSLDGFRKLTDAGIFNVGQMNDAIQKFRYFEKKSLGLVV